MLAIRRGLDATVETRHVEVCHVRGTARAQEAVDRIAAATKEARVEAACPL